ncbi:DUF3857 domain-containing protein [Paludibacter sp. 221]|uniref:DUF3857 domain-containing protein n=1 Tax=Paludibacter sp. 221 TaxID=2302939 RepID=UPI0013D13594|nr:DUF3857 domain-containing protein [Paludibacter sp. 221]NDV47481.1 DUF3857 domain-containing protein [Paludibacter sp. 221]
MRLLVSLIFVFFCSLASADSFRFSVSEIPDSLKKDAFGVLRFSNVEFDYISEKSGVEKQSYAITILNKNEKQLADFVTYGDKFRELKKFSATLYNANGEVLRKFKMSDIETTEMSDGLANDRKYYFFHCETPIFPFTIHYEYEINWKNGIFSFPIFYPQSSYSLAVQNATYQLSLPPDLKIRQKALNNMPENPDITVEKGKKIYKWKVENLKAIESESFAPQLRTLVPMLYISPESFIYDKVSGTITDWESYGKWVSGLMYGRDVLPAAFKDKIISMTQNAGSDYEKIKILYDYLGETTRYVSIQLGIGGFQPMFASEVNKTGFGDCKALSFYLKSMLEVIDIPSNYVEIRSDRRNKRMFPDYATFYETNHVILQVPLEKDTLWLECTNPRIPFGFVHNNIAGHDAVEIKSEGGRFCQLPDYPDSLNVDKNSATVKLREDGSASIQAEKEYHLKVYNDFFGLNEKKKNEQVDIFRRGINLPNATVNSVQITENKSIRPNFFISYDWQTTLYGTKTGNRLFIPVNPYRNQYNWFKKKERKYDIDIWRGFNDIDSIFISIPENYEIETLPMPVFITTKYGDFRSIVFPKEEGILITQSFYSPAGKYQLAEYTELRDFFEKINSAYNSKIILKRKERN